MAHNVHSGDGIIDAIRGDSGADDRLVAALESIDETLHKLVTVVEKIYKYGVSYSREE